MGLLLQRECTAKVAGNCLPPPVLPLLSEALHRPVLQQGPPLSCPFLPCCW